MNKRGILETLTIIRLAADTALGMLQDARDRGVSESLTGEELEALLGTQMNILEATGDYQTGIPVQARTLH